MIYHDWQSASAPVWLQRANGRAWNEAHGLIKDVIVDGARVATKASWPLATPADGLPFIGNERSLSRVPSDTDETYRQRLADAWELWAYGGTNQGVIAAVETRFPGSSPSILTYWDDPAYFGVDPERWARWALFLTLDTWGKPAKWGSGVRWGDPSLKWGVSAPQGEVDELKAIIRTWGAGYALCVKVVVTTPDGVLEVIP